MKLDQILVRSSRIGLSFIMLLTLNANPAWASSEEEGLLPIEKSQVNKSLIDDLFNPNGNNNSNNNPNRNNNQNPNKNQNQNPNRVSNQNQNQNLNQNRNRNNNNNSNYNKNASKIADIDADFQCNLFESVPFEEILSAVNALNAAVNSPSCGESKMNVQGIVDNNKAIKDAVTALRGYKENPETVQPENAPDIVANVDAAIRAATSVANSFAQSDLLKKECRQSMNAGDIAVAVSDLINGLTPYALMAASFTGGTAAIPFIVGGSILTNAVGSMAKIVGENSPDVKDAQVRRAIVENACQYIRLDQKYKFLIKSRQEQVNKITADLSASQRLFSAKIDGLAPGANTLMDRKSALDKVAMEINSNMSSVRSQIELDKQFMKSTSDDIKLCQLGVQMAVLAKDQTSYIATVRNSLDQAMTAYGSNSIAQAQALKVSSDLAIKHLEQVAAKQFSGKVDFNKCASMTRSFVETIDQSASLSRQLVKIAQESVEKGLQTNREYANFKARLSTLNQKQFQATRVTESLDNLRAYANAISQSEINSEMERLRRGLFNNGAFGAYGSSSPVLMWFKHVKGLHDGAVKNFQEGLSALRLRASRMTKTGSVVVATYPGYYQVNKAQLEQDQKDAQNMVPFNLKQLPLGTADHEGVCRELDDVWNRWTVAVDHLAAMDAFCSMIEPYVYDTRPEDYDLVKMCRGFTKQSAAAGTYGARLSTVAQAKDDLVKNKTRDWALFLQTKMDALVCLQNKPVLE
ncbi:hypothetical protein [Bdellovibrio sp. HCB337]|uniref:hypothetical protein n=1 Tax=Bdellovibrio sp. HCB337 TaxID=3394358 RepID=UPI0039A5C437